MSENGNSIQELAVVLDIEGGPPAVAVLHGEHPVHRPADDVAPADTRVALQEGEHHGGRVVDVRVPGVGVLERPAARLAAAVVDPPVTVSFEDLLALDPASHRGEPGIAPSWPESASPMSESAESHTGDWQASMRKPSSSAMLKRWMAVEAAPDR